MLRRVVVTGMGCVSPLAHNVSTTWDALLAGQSAVGPITLFDAANYPSKIAAEVKDWDGPHRQLPRQTQFVLNAAEQAIAQAGLIGNVEPARLSVYLGCGEIFPDLQAMTQLVAQSLQGDRFSADRYCQLAESHPMFAGPYEPNDALMRVAAAIGAEGQTTNCITACTSSSLAIGSAAELIRQNEADAVAAGGAHSMISPFGVTGFARLSALTTEWNDQPELAMRPFDASRSGFVIGEGSGMLILEEREHAMARGAEILCEVTGFGAAQDAYRITDPHPQGRGAIAAIKMALSDAQLAPEQISYISAHGTSTVMNDRMETEAIKSAFGENARQIPISSIKSMVGHLTTACGVLEAVACVRALLSQAIPPTINFETPDVDCDLDYTPREARQIECRHILSNSFGFGGQNVSLIFSQR